MDYISNINPDDYRFLREITITEPGYYDRYNYKFSIIFNSENFNFDLIRSDGFDIRVAENSNGSKVLPFFRSNWNKDYRNGEIWFKLPLLRKDEIKTLYVYFGNSTDEDLSDPLLMDFIFFEDFKFIPLSKWTGDVNVAINESYGYFLDTYDIITTIDNVLLNKKSWIFELGFYNLDSSWTSSTRSMQIDFNGTNGFYVLFDDQDSYFKSNLIDSTNETVFYGGGIAPTSYARLHISYEEDRDLVTVGQSCRITGEDYVITNERRVLENTELTNIKYYGRHDYGSDSTVYHGADPLYTRWLIIRDYIKPEEVAILDLTNLRSDYDNLYGQNIDSIVYTSDFTDIDYFHYSNCGGDPYKLSNNLSGDITTSFISDYELEKEVLIDFGRSAGIVNSSKNLHYDSGHVYQYNASRMSEAIYGEDAFGRTYWHCTSDTGWACIDFDDQHKIINCIVIKIFGSIGTPKDIKIQGGFDDPRLIESVWKDLKISTISNVTGAQAFYLNNDNPYRYYRIYVQNTWDGKNIIIDEWEFYESFNKDKKVVKQLRLLPLSTDSQDIYFPKTFDFYGSNDQKIWVLLGEYTTYTPFFDGPFGRWQRFDVANDTGYYSYKIVFGNSWNETSNITIVDEWELVGIVESYITYQNLAGSTMEVFSITADKNTTFDSGMVYLGNDFLSYVYDNENVKTVLSDILLTDILLLN